MVIQVIFIETALHNIFYRRDSHSLKSFMTEGSINATLGFERLTLQICGDKVLKTLYSGNTIQVIILHM